MRLDFNTQFNFEVIPIYKKGDTRCPGNYRGIALLDVFSKLYISILTTRLTFYCEAYTKLSESQAGFRAGYSTIDNAFVLYSIISKYLGMKKRFIYVAFVDFQKAFDSIDRNVLYEILHNNGLSGHLYSAIVSIYSCVKAYVREGGLCSNILYCTKGLRQGCKLSPMLFALYINELR